MLHQFLVTLQEKWWINGGMRRICWANLTKIKSVFSDGQTAAGQLGENEWIWAKQMMEANKWASWRQWNKQTLHLWPGLCLGCDLFEYKHLWRVFGASTKDYKCLQFQTQPGELFMRCKMMLVKKSGQVCVSGCAKEGKAYAGKVYLCPKWVTS